MTTEAKPRSLIAHLRPTGPSAGEPGWTAIFSDTSRKLVLAVHDALYAEDGVDYVIGPRRGREDQELIVSLKAPVLPHGFKPSRVRGALLIQSVGIQAVLGVRVVGFGPRPARGGNSGRWLVNEPVPIPASRSAHERRTRWGKIPDDIVAYELHCFLDKSSGGVGSFRVLACWGEVELVEESPATPA